MCEMHKIITYLGVVGCLNVNFDHPVYFFHAQVHF